jgi:hypothetical protein
VSTGQPAAQKHLGSSASEADFSAIYKPLVLKFYAVKDIYIGNYRKKSQPHSFNFKPYRANGRVRRMDEYAVAHSTMRSACPILYNLSLKNGW